MTSNIQSIVDHIQSQSESLKFTLNEDKCQEMRIQFSKVQSRCLPLTIYSKELALVNQVKVLGVIISNDLKWNSHVDSIVRKASKHMYFLRQLKRANVSCDDLVQYYCPCIRPVVEYASPVFHYALPAYLNDELERIQKRALSIITSSDTPYGDALEHIRISTLAHRRRDMCNTIFNSIVNNPDHKLYNLLPTPNANCEHSLRYNREFNNPICKTNRPKNSFIIACANNRV